MLFEDLAAALEVVLIQKRVFLEPFLFSHLSITLQNTLALPATAAAGAAAVQSLGRQAPG